jgi:hypothetical protein
MNSLKVLFKYIVDFISCLFFNKKIDEYSNSDKVYVKCVNGKYEIHMHAFTFDTTFALESKQFGSFFSATRHYLKNKKKNKYIFLLGV